MKFDNSTTSFSWLWLSFLAGALTMLLSAGCVSSLLYKQLYNHADWLLTQQLDNYFDLSRSQKTFVADRLDGILEQHRHDALPRYEAVLTQAHARIQRGLTRDDILWAFTQYDGLRTDLMARFVPDGTTFVRLVEEPQIVRARLALQKRLSKQEKLLRESQETRLTTRAERIVDLAEEWLGSLTQQQEDEISLLGMQFPDTLPAWYTHQLHRNEQLLAVIESSGSTNTRARLYDWLVNQEKGADANFLEGARQTRQHVVTLILTLDRLATPEQRNHVLEKLDELIQTIHGLSKI